MPDQVEEVESKELEPNEDGHLNDAQPPPQLGTQPQNGHLVIGEGSLNSSPQSSLSQDQARQSEDEKHSN